MPINERNSYHVMNNTLLLLVCLTAGQSSQCQNPPASSSNTDLVVTRDAHGTVATYICPPGWYFADGGTRRTLICTNGSWPRHAPMCTGSVGLQKILFRFENRGTFTLFNLWTSRYVIRLTFGGIRLAACTHPCKVKFIFTYLSTLTQISKWVSK